MNLKTLISQEELEKRIKEIAEQITEEYENKELIIICILKYLPKVREKVNLE